MIKSKIDARERALELAIETAAWKFRECYWDTVNLNEGGV